VAYNATVERARVRPGDSVSIVGSGPIGLFAAEMALLCGASSVLVVGIDGDESRLAQAKEVGATTLLASSREAETGELAWWHRSKFNSRSDVVIDAAGVSATLEAALEVVKPGGQVVKVGWGPEPYNQPLDTLVAKAVELHGSFSHTWTTWERVLRLLGEGRLRAGRYTQACDVSEWEKAFEAMSSRRLVKSVITFS
jgi:alcohol dehydrogenase/L-iditol 2-dehydrogenase